MARRCNITVQETRNKCWSLLFAFLLEYLLLTPMFLEWLKTWEKLAKFDQTGGTHMYCSCRYNGGRRDIEEKGFIKKGLERKVWEKKVKAKNKTKRWSVSASSHHVLRAFWTVYRLELSWIQHKTPIYSFILTWGKKFFRAGASLEDKRVKMMIAELPPRTSCNREV